MFWKLAKLNPFKAGSFVTQLTRLYTLSTLGILLAVCVFLYPSLIKILTNNAQAHTTYEYPLDQEGKRSITIKCYKGLITILLLGAAASIVLGYFISRNALRRIEEFTDKIEKINADSLQDRINPSDWPDELKTLAERFNLMLDRVETSFSQLSQFSSDISHELRNPINNLRGMTEIALSSEKTPEEYRETLESCVDEYQYLSTLLENLLFLARSDYGQIKIKRSAYSAQTETLKMFDYFQSVADEKQIALQCEGDATIMVEPTLFKRVINNLLSNALRHSNQNGTITVRIQPVEIQRVQICIQDTGEGIAPEHLPKIFDRFYRADSSRSALSGGVGLGLAIVKSIVELHDGAIHIESQVGVGTTVCMGFITKM